MVVSQNSSAFLTVVKTSHEARDFCFVRKGGVGRSAGAGAGVQPLVGGVLPYPDLVGLERFVAPVSYGLLSFPERFVALLGVLAQKIEVLVRDDVPAGGTPCG